MSDRDTQFAGFAKLLAQELVMEAQRPDVSEIHLLLARRAYDLVLHTAWNIASVDLQRLTMEEVAAKVPDITQWPEADK